MHTHVVSSNGLNLRSEPRVVPNNKIAILPQGTPVTAGTKRPDGWWEVTGNLAGLAFRGFVASRYLQKVADEAPTGVGAAQGKLPPAIWGEHDARVKRVNPAGAKPLGEAGMPMNDGSRTPQQFFHDFIQWAQVDNNAHLRWRPGNGRTYCNIYAHDVCYAAKTYLPRVWWKPDAIARLRKGESVAVEYDRTVRELNANALHDWLLDYGGEFGWQRTLSLEELQDAANAGHAAVICAARKDPSRSGHITMVVPEQAGTGAARTQGKVLRPLQSQAGSTNFRLGTGVKRWWEGTQFRSFVLFHNRH